MFWCSEESEVSAEWWRRSWRGAADKKGVRNSLKISWGAERHSDVTVIVGIKGEVIWFSVLSGRGTQNKDGLDLCLIWSVYGCTIPATVMFLLYQRMAVSKVLSLGPQKSRKTSPARKDPAKEFLEIYGSSQSEPIPAFPIPAVLNKNTGKCSYNCAVQSKNIQSFSVCACVCHARTSLMSSPTRM